MHDPHPCLHHEDTPPSHVLYILVDVDGLLPQLETLHHGIQCNESSRTPHPRTAVDKEGNPLALVMGLLYPPHKAEDGGGRLGYPLVRPGGVVEVSYLKRSFFRLHLLWGREAVRLEGRGEVRWEGLEGSDEDILDLHW